MSSHDARSLRQSKRMSVTALYLSMSAKEKDLEISDDLSKGEINRINQDFLVCWID
jgi:Ras GTPase-activating-like protein IQGAP2/3